MEVQPVSVAIQIHVAGCLYQIMVQKRSDDNLFNLKEQYNFESPTISVAIERVLVCVENTININLILLQFIGVMPGCEMY